MNQGIHFKRIPIHFKIELLCIFDQLSGKVLAGVVFLITATHDSSVLLAIFRRRSEGEKHPFTSKLIFAENVIAKLSDYRKKQFHIHHPNHGFLEKCR